MIKPVSTGFARSGSSNKRSLVSDRKWVLRTSAVVPEFIENVIGARELENAQIRSIRIWNRKSGMFKDRPLRSPLTSNSAASDDTSVSKFSSVAIQENVSIVCKIRGTRLQDSEFEQVLNKVPVYALGEMRVPSCK